MKLIVLLIGSFTFISVNGQKIHRKIDNVNFDKDSISSGNPVLEALAFNETNYKFLFRNEKGKVYESTIDHMRCLAPDFPLKMPVAELPKIKNSKPEQMPNAFSKKHTLPPLSLKK
jgi:hypothetical protein